VHDAVTKAVKRARDGKGPSLIECETYRYVGHSRTDPGLYRTKEEMDEYLAKDPIPRLKKYMLDEKLASEAEITAVEVAVEKELEDSVEFARNSPHPKPEDALKYVFVGEGG